jgi:hypothetical protein
MVWTPEQTGQFLDFAAADRHYALWHLIALRGLRRGKAIGLDRSEINQEKPRSPFAPAPATARKPTRTSPKTTTARPPPRTRRAAPSTWTGKPSRSFDSNREHQRHLGDLYEDSGRVCTDELGRPPVPKSVSQSFDRLIAHYENIRRPVTFLISPTRGCRPPSPA